MNQWNKIEVIDRNGWRKEFPIGKTIIHVGSDPRSDIFLEPGRGTGVASLHAQLIASAGRSGCQLVNLGDADILLGLSGDQALPPRSVTHIVHGAAFRLGDFTLLFYGEEGSDRVASGGFTSSSQHIGLSISLPQTRLEPNQSLEGLVTLSNLGEGGAVQFDLELEGLEPDCYDIEPGPILASGTEKDLIFRLYHRGNKPLAGDYHITICATAPRTYPGEEAVASQVVRVLPFYRHKLRLFPLAGVGRSPRVEERAARAEAGPPSQTEDWWRPTPVTATERAPQAEAVAPPRRKAAKRAARAQPGPPPQVEEPGPEAEAGPPSPGAAEPTPPIEAGLAAQAEPEEEGAPEAETAPAGLIDDEGSLEAEAGRQPQAEQRLAETEAGLPAQAEEEAEAEAGPPPPAGDWRVAEAETEPERQTEQPPVLKLKVSPPAEAEAEAEEAQVKAGPPPPAGDWWAAEAETGPEQQPAKRPVLKMKASLPPEMEEASEAEAGPPPAAEDWWAASQAEEEPAPEE